MNRYIKNLLYGCFLQLLFLTNTVAQASPEFEFTLYAQDAIGNVDSVVIGYDHNEPNASLNAAFGEIPLTSPFDSIFEMRLKGDANLSSMPYTKKVISHYIGDCMPSGGTADVAVILRAKHKPIRFSWDRNALLAGNTPYCHGSMLLFDTNLYWFVPDWTFLNPIQMHDTNQVVMAFDTSQRPRGYYPVRYVNVQGGGVDSAVTMYVVTNARGWVATQNTARDGDDLHLYPNPSDNSLVLNLENSLNERIKKVEIYTIAGARQAEFTPTHQALQGNLELDVSKYPTGMYVLKSVMDERILTKSFIVQH